jgi:hypothetical protein
MVQQEKEEMMKENKREKNGSRVTLWAMRRQLNGSCACRRYYEHVGKIGRGATSCQEKEKKKESETRSFLFLSLQQRRVERCVKSFANLSNPPVLEHFRWELSAYKTFLSWTILCFRQNKTKQTNLPKPGKKDEEWREKKSTPIVDCISHPPKKLLGYIGTYCRAYSIAMFTVNIYSLMVGKAKKI